MKWITPLREWLWPVLEHVPREENERQKAQLASDRASILGLDLTQECHIALEEARRFADAEDERRRGADQKATTYLAVIAALVPIVVALATAVWNKKLGGAPVWVNVFVLGVAVAYVSVAGIWAFRVLEVSVSHRIGVQDFIKSWRSSEPAQEIARLTLLCGRLNQTGANSKVTNIKMAHAFLLRAFLTFSGLLTVNIFFFFGAAISTSANAVPDPSSASPRSASIMESSAPPLRFQLHSGHSDGIGSNYTGAASICFGSRDCKSEIIRSMGNPISAQK